MKNIKVLKQLNIMVILTIITQIFILIKNAIVASYFGISAELDAFNLANRITTFIYSFIGAGISTVIIPYLRDKVNKKAVNIFISVIYTAGLILLGLIIFFNEEIISLASGSNNNYFIALSSNLLIFTALTGFIDSLIRLAKAILEFNEKFNTEKLIVLFSNILIVVLLLIGFNNIYYYTFVILIATILNFIFHSIFIKKTNFEFRIKYNIGNKGFREMLTLFFPTMLSTGVYQISLLIDTLIAARLSVGSISTLNYANAIISMINLLLLGNITSFVYPKLVKKYNNMERQASIVGYILLANVLMCFIIVLFYSVGQEGVSILFERGRFTSENTSIVYLIALILTLSLPTNATRDLLYRYFYLNKDTHTPFKNSIIVSIFNIIISLVLSEYIGLYGIVIGTVLSSYFSLLSIGIRFKKKFQVYINFKKFLFENSKIIIVTILAIVASISFKELIVIKNIYVSLIINGLFSVVVFFVLLKLLRSRIFNIEL